MDFSKAFIQVKNIIFTRKLLNGLINSYAARLGKLMYEAVSLDGVASQMEFHREVFCCL